MLVVGVMGFPVKEDISSLDAVEQGSGTFPELCACWHINLLMDVAQVHVCLVKTQRDILHKMSAASHQKRNDVHNALWIFHICLHVPCTFNVLLNGLMCVQSVLIASPMCSRLLIQML